MKWNRYHVGLLITKNGDAIFQFEKKVDFLNCEINEYFGVRETTKKDAKKRMCDKKHLILADLRERYPHKNIKRVKII